MPQPAHVHQPRLPSEGGAQLKFGHLQRGGTPTAFDRVLATRFGTAALELAARGRFGRMVCLKGQAVTSVPLARAIARLKLVPRNHTLIRVARAVGTAFGD